MSSSPLNEILRAQIAANGSLSVGQYMALCLGHPIHGYYMAQEAFGTKGDFITAPEISQIFGEMLAAWVVLAWERLGKPADLQLVELGPGRGTLMRDIWRGLGAIPELRNSLTVHLVEFSPRLQATQKDALSGVPVIWHTTIATLPTHPSIVVANEFFDALPVEQAIFDGTLWRERLVTVMDNQLAFTLGKGLAGLPPAPRKETIFEYSPVTGVVMADLCGHLKQHGGALLAIDYGDDIPFDTRFGETLQALQNHMFIDVLAAPGTSDLTAHVAFSSLAAIALEQECNCMPIQTQREFLTELGIRLRAEKLIAKATAAQADTLRSGLNRLVDPAEMGDLFKVLQVFADVI